MAIKRHKKPGEDAFGILMLVLALGFVWQSYEIAGFSALSSPGSFPLAASSVMTLAGLIVVVANLRRRVRVPKAGEVGTSAGDRSFFQDVMPPVVIIFSGMVVCFAVLLGTLGFLPTAFAFLFAAILYLHRGGVAFSFLVALGSLVAIYVVFRLIFKVVLPEGIVPEREIMAYIQALFASGGAR